MFWETDIKPRDRNTDNKDSELKVGSDFFLNCFKKTKIKSFIHKIQFIDGTF